MTADAESDKVKRCIINCRKVPDHDDRFLRMSEIIKEMNCAYRGKGENRPRQWTFRNKFLSCECPAHKQRSSPRDKETQNCILRLLARPEKSDPPLPILPQRRGIERVDVDLHIARFISASQQLAPAVKDYRRSFF